MSHLAERQMAVIATVVIIISCLIRVCVFPGNVYADDIEIRSITENPQGSLHKVRSVVGTVERIIYERGDEGGSCYELRDDYGGRIQVVSVDKLPENFVSKKARVKGKVELNNETSDPTDVCIFENERQIFGSGVPPPPPVPWGLIIIAVSGIVSVIACIVVFIIVYVKKIFTQVKNQGDRFREEGLEKERQKELDEKQKAKDITKRLLGSRFSKNNGSSIISLYKGTKTVTPEGGCSFIIRRELEEDKKLKDDEMDVFILLQGNGVCRTCHAKLLVDEYEKKFELQHVSDKGATYIHSKGGTRFELKRNDKVELNDNDQIMIGEHTLVFEK